MERFQIRVRILYGFKQHHKAKEAHVSNVKVFRENALTNRNIKMLYKEF